MVDRKKTYYNNKIKIRVIIYQFTKPKCTIKLKLFFINLQMGT